MPPFSILTLPVAVAALVSNTSPSLWIPVLATTGVIASAVIAYFTAKRSTSGNIANSASTELWDESKAIRVWLGEETMRLSGENDILRKRVGVLEDEVVSVRAENEILKRRITGCETENVTLKTKIASLEEK